MTNVFSDADRVVLQSLQLPDDASIYYTPAGGSRVKLDDVIFRSPDTPIVGDDLMFEGVGPQFAAHVEDVPDLGHDDLFERAKVIYVVNNIGRDEGFIRFAHCRLY